jgi:oxygen-independent coproporphyrinogen-3 oxidase
LTDANDKIVALSREGLLRVDSLLPRFFLPQHTGIRYT